MNNCSFRHHIMDIVTIKLIALSGILPFDVIIFLNGYIYEALTDENIRFAIDLWYNDRITCLLRFGHISYWCVKNVTNMYMLFLKNEEFDDDISRWDVSNVTDMSCMFIRVKKFNSDISNWNVSKVTDMRRMFYNTTTFNCNISNWNISDVTNRLGMFLSRYMA